VRGHLGDKPSIATDDKWGDTFFSTGRIDGVSYGAKPTPKYYNWSAIFSVDRRYKAGAYSGFQLWG